MSDGTAVDIYEPVIADLRLRIAGMQAMLDNLENLRSGGTMQSTGNSTTPRISTFASFGHDAFFNMRAADAAKEYLNAIRKTATIATISDALLAGGWKTSAKNVAENLRTILSRHPDFVRINGEFGLADWYPGRKSGRRQGTATSSATEDNPSTLAEAVAMLSENQGERTSTVPSMPSGQ